ncbi:MAG: hypothetical protein WCC48_04865 [Anaeromyxobacteraceae bacterium]
MSATRFLRKMRRHILAGLALSISAGCIIARPMNDVGPIRDRTDAGQGMIVGHLVYPGHEIQGILLYEDGTSYFGMEPRAPRAHVYPNGDFVFEGLKPVAYRILLFYSGGITYAVMTHETKDDPGHRYEVRPGAITYVGSYVFGDYQIISRVERPGLREILQGLLPLTRGTYWEGAIRQRLAAAR